MIYDIYIYTRALLRQTRQDSSNVLIIFSGFVYEHDNKAYISPGTVSAVSSTMAVHGSHKACYAAFFCQVSRGSNSDDSDYESYGGGLRAAGEVQTAAEALEIQLKTSMLKGTPRW